MFFDGEFFSSINAKKDGFITLEYENIRFFFIPRHFVPPLWRGDGWRGHFAYNMVYNRAIKCPHCGIYRGKYYTATALPLFREVQRSWGGDEK